MSGLVPFDPEFDAASSRPDSFAGGGVDLSTEEGAMSEFRIRNLVSGLFVPVGVRDAVPLAFGSYEEAQLWLVHIDAPLGDFAIVEWPEVAA